MSLRSVLIVLLALVFGGSAAVGITSLRPQAPSVSADSVDVVVAVVDIPRATTVTTDMVKTKSWPAEGVPPGAVTNLEEALGRTALNPMVQGEPLTETRLAPRGSARGLPALIPLGMKAVTIQVPNVAVGVGGFVQPGDKVDVVLAVGESFSVRDAPYGGGTAATLLQNVEVLAVDQRMDASDGRKADAKDMRSVTLLVTTDQAAMLVLGQKQGTLQLSLRNPEDKDAATPRALTMADLRFHQEKPWDVRLRGALEGFGKKFGEELAKMPAPTKPEPKAERKPAPEEPPTIRLLNGVQMTRVPLSSR